MLARLTWPSSFGASNALRLMVSGTSAAAGPTAFCRSATSITASCLGAGEGQSCCWLAIAATAAPGAGAGVVPVLLRRAGMEAAAAALAAAAAAAAAVAAAGCPGAATCSGSSPALCLVVDAVAAASGRPAVPEDGSKFCRRCSSPAGFGGGCCAGSAGSDEPGMGTWSALLLGVASCWKTACC